MKIRSVLTGAVYQARFSTEHPASSYGQPVLLVKKLDGTEEAIDRWAFQILDDEDGLADDEEPKQDI